MTIGGCRVGLSNRGLRLWRRLDRYSHRLAAQQVAGPGDGIPLRVEKILQAQDQLDVTLSVETLLVAVLGRTNRGDFALPVAQDVGFNASEFGDFSINY